MAEPTGNNRVRNSTPTKFYDFDPERIHGERKTPLGLVIDASAPPQFPCDAEYLEGKIDFEEWQRCVVNSHIPESERRILQARERREVETEAKFLNRFHLSVSQKYRTAEMFYQEFEDYYTRMEFPPGVGLLSTDGRIGTRVALTTDHQYIKLDESLLRLVIFDVTFYGSDQQKTVDDYSWNILDVEYLLSLSERSFLELGGTMLETDLLSGWLMSGPSGQIGIAAQIRGTPLNTDEKFLDVTNRPSLLQSYTMIRAALEVGFLQERQVDEILCAKVWNGGYCEESFQYQRDPDEADQEGTLQVKSSFELLGEQLYPNNLLTSIAYSVYASHFPFADRVDVGGQIEGEIKIAPGVHLFLGGSARYLKRMDKEDEGYILRPVNLDSPTKAYEIQIEGGLRLYPGRLFQ